MSSPDNDALWAFNEQTVLQRNTVTRGDGYWHIDSQVVQRAHVRLRAQTYYKWSSHYLHETRQEIIMWARRHLNWQSGPADKEMYRATEEVDWSFYTHVQRFMVTDKANKYCDVSEIHTRTLRDKSTTH